MARFDDAVGDISSTNTMSTNLENKMASLHTRIIGTA